MTISLQSSPTKQLDDVLYPVIAVETSPTFFQTWAQKTVLAVFSKMTLGKLLLTCPNGVVFSFGQDTQAPAVVLNVKRWRFFTQLLLNADIGLAESYMDGDWDTPDLSQVLSWLILNVSEETPFAANTHQIAWMNYLGILNRWVHRLRPNSVKNSRKNISAHYDLSNDFFALFLDPSMTYSAALFEAPEQSLEEAQKAKWTALATKLKLKNTDTVLEIGSGWGGFAIFAAQTYGCHVTTVTISQQQYDYAKAKIEALGLTERISLQFRDYRTLTGKFDKIVSIEMIEAVGDAYYEAFFEVCYRCLKPNGLLGLQMITCPDSRYNLIRRHVDFIQKHIFPGSLLPSIGRINRATQATGTLFLHSLDDMGNHYAKTLRTWDQAFLTHAQSIRDLGFDTAFIRKWHYYFEYCVAAFWTRNITVVQAVYTKPNNLTLQEVV